MCSIQDGFSLNQIIFVKVLDGKYLAFPFNPLSRLSCYYKNIEQKENFDVNYFRLFFAGKQLQGNKALSDYSIPPRSTLHLKLRVIQIFVKNLTGQTLIIDSHAKDSIYKIKQKIQAKDGVPATHQCLIYGGKQLGNDQTIMNCSIRDGSTLHLVLRMRGGGPLPLSFVNIKEEKIKMISFSEKAPKWRIVRPGLNLLGKCIIPTCQAFQQFIWIPKGFGTFNMNKECEESMCPMCENEASKVNNFGVYSCFFSIQGSFRNAANGEHTKFTKFNKEKTQAPDDQLLSFKDNGSAAEWKYLEIITERLDILPPSQLNNLQETKKESDYEDDLYF